MNYISLFVVCILCLAGCKKPEEKIKVVTFSDRLKLAEEGDAEAQNQVAVAFLQGTEGERDLERAMHWFLQAADAEHSRALYNLGVLHQEGKYVSEDHRKAFDYFLNAARRGLPEAQMSIGWLYEGGLGTMKDMTEAVYWYRRAATFGKAADRARSYYSENLLDHRDSQYLYGNMDAQFLLGRLFEEGNEMMSSDLDMAVEWYEDAAVRGDGASASRLAVLLGLKGKPRPDPVMGYAWAKVAVESRGLEGADQILSSIQKIMDPSEQTKGEAQSEKLFELIQHNRANL
ncbi:sel1 repeat family protein [bacterium]|jgi:TPR repeat protein|nr:sel1 repeat family protein [Verrucomicrobiota bacterium]MDA7497268.1 sel1 repeat family protein [bacterium]